MFDHFSLVRRISQVGTILMTRMLGVQVGADTYGNRYFSLRRKHASELETRWVLYAREPEATKVPPEWFAWLHNMCDELLPTATENRYVWQKPHQPNLSGTEAALLPTGHPLHHIGKECCVSTGDSYQSWKPPT